MPRRPTPDDPTRTLGSSEAPTGPRPDAPASIGPYPILSELGRGGMGVVYLARDPRLERDVALKMLPPEIDSGPEARQRFLGEARTLAALNHPNIATIFSLEQSGERHFLTMERVEGRSLRDRLRQSVPPIDETLSLMRQVARGVEAAHTKGVIHRDLKPSNVMMQDDGTVKVLDFGLAVRLEAGATIGEVAGTPGYMSPEQIRGEAPDPRTDVWAVGCMLYECLSGDKLIKGDSAAERISATLSVDAESALDAGALEGELPPRLSLLLKRSLSARAADRFASMREVRLLIEEEIAERVLPPVVDERPAAPAVQLAPGNLPRRLTSFVGRGEDLEQTARLLDEHRMVTITGAGGCGKTRLALELAGRMQGTFPDGVWLIELASLGDPAMVPASAAAAMAVQQTPGTSILDGLLQFLGEKRTLLALDNCEHLLDPCADLVTRVLAACPNVRILATSRESLRVEGEAAYALAPLPVPRPAGEDSDAVLLFVDRARAVLPAFRLDDTNRAAIHEICRRLDGIPLAIELAAARVKTLPVEKIRDLLDDRFRLLTRGSRTAQAHQSTLRELIDWSYDRLDGREQAVFRRLSVFRGAWTLDAVEAVGAGAGVEPWDALDLFTRLVEKSLIVRDVAVQSAAHARYSMLETVRVYAREKLRESSEEERIALRRHRDYVVALSMEGEEGLRGRDQVAWDVRLTDAVDDVRSVLDLVAHDPDGAGAGLSLVGSYGYQWLNRGMWQEGSAAIARALAHPGADRTSAPFGKALVAAGNLAYRMGELDRARGLYQDALAVLSRVGTDQQIGSVYLNLGNIAFGKGETDEAERFYETSLTHYRRANSTVWIAGCLTNLSVIALAREDIDRLESMETEALRIYEASGIRSGMCLALLQLGIAACVRGENDLARARWDRSLALAREIDHGWNIMAALENIAFLEVSRGRFEEARAVLGECMARLIDMRDPIIALIVLEEVACVAADPRPAESARLLAAATALRAKLEMPLLWTQRPLVHGLGARLAKVLGAEGMERARADGERMSLDAALAAAQELMEASR